MNKVLTIGTFDLLHVGHLELFKACRRLADRGPFLVGVNVDEFVQQFKQAPIIPTSERYQLVKAASGANLVLHNFSAGRALIEQARPDIIAIGDDWLPAERYYKQIDVDEAFLAHHGIRVEFVPRTTGQSTSRIKERVLRSAQ
jgi:glycerol-3-phosphate cytidylyltransferase